MYRRKAIGLLVALLFLLGLMPLSAFAADNAEFWYSSEPVIRGGDEQALGQIEVRIPDGSDYALYVTVELPEGVEYAEAATDSTASKYVSEAESLEWSSTGGLKVRVDEVDTIHITFDGDSKVDIARDAPTEIAVTVTIQARAGLLGGGWTEQQQGVVGVAEEGSLSVEASSARTVTRGRDRRIASITIEEDDPATLRAEDPADRVILTLLTSGYQWELPSLNWVEGQNGLEVDKILRSDDGRSLSFVIGGSSSTRPGELEINPRVWVKDSAAAGTARVKVTTSPPILEATTLDVAKLEGTPVSDSDDDSDDDSNVGVSVRNDSSDILYRASSGAVIDTIIVQTDPRMRAGETITLTLLDEGVQWYRIKYPSSVESLGFATDNQTATFRLRSNVNEVLFTGAQVSVLPDAALGSARVRVSGSAGAYGTVSVGEVTSPIIVSTAKKDIQVGSNQRAGNITFRENGGAQAWRDGNLYLSLPTGVTFAHAPRVTVNGRTVTVANASGASRLELNINASDSEDRVVIENISYNVGLGAGSGDVKVQISGSAVNRLTNGSSGAIGSVVNARITGGQVAPVSPYPSYSPAYPANQANPASGGTARVAVFAYGSKAYSVNGAVSQMDVAPFIKDGRTYLPLRYAGYSLGVPEGQIGWDGKKVTLTKSNTTVVVTVGSKVMLVNDTRVSMDVAPVLVQPGRVMLPYRWIAEAFGAAVNWDPGARTVTMQLTE